MYLVDTNVVSELRKARSGKADLQVVEWSNRTRLSDMYICAVTIFEIEIGLLSVERRDPPQGARLRGWFEKQVMATFRHRVLPIDAVVARRAAKLHVPDRRPERDAFIAAAALVHGMTVVTRNTSDFNPTGVATIDPWMADAATRLP